MIIARVDGGPLAREIGTGAFRHAPRGHHSTADPLSPLWRRPLKDAIG